MCLEMHIEPKLFCWHFWQCGGKIKDKPAAKMTQIYPQNSGPQIWAMLRGSEHWTQKGEKRNLGSRKSKRVSGGVEWKWISMLKLVASKLVMYALLAWCFDVALFTLKKSKTKRLLLILLLFYELLLLSYILCSVICSLSIFIMTLWKKFCYVQCM